MSNGTSNGEPNGEPIWRPGSVKGSEMTFLPEWKTIFWPSMSDDGRVSYLLAAFP